MHDTTNTARWAPKLRLDDLQISGRRRGHGALVIAWGSWRTRHRVGPGVGSGTGSEACGVGTGETAPA